MFAWVFGPFPGSAYMGLPSQQALSDWVFQTFPLFPAITPESLTHPCGEMNACVLCLRSAVQRAPRL